MSVIALLLLLITSAFAVAQSATPRSRLVPCSPKSSRHRSTVESIGAWLRQRARRPPDAMLDRSVGQGLILFVIITPMSFQFALMGLALPRLRSVAVRRRTEQDRIIAIERGLAQTIDLFLVALRSGHNMSAAVDHVGRWVRGDLGHAFVWCSGQVVAGRTLSDALEMIPDRVGPTVRPLIGALVANDRHGAPILSTLAQLALESRAAQRRRAEMQARRLPVLLLVPLAVCVLPAFMALTVVPVVADSFSNFESFVSP